MMIWRRLAFVVLMGSLGPAGLRAEDPVRVKSLAAFDQLMVRGAAEYDRLTNVPKYLNGAAQVPLADKDFQSRIKAVESPAGPSKLAVKVAFKLIEGPNAGKYVDPERYVWGPKERTRIVVVTPVPILVYYYDIKSQNNNEIRTRLFPRKDPADKDPSWTPLEPGLHTLSLRLITDNNNQNELWTMSILAQGSPNIPQPEVDDDQRVFLSGAKATQIEAMTDEMRRERKAGQAKYLVTRPKPTMTGIHENLVDAAIVLVSPTDRGDFDLVIQKK